ncbi:MAG: Nramp family divalent metal transporter [Bacteroidales bacterium]|nr:Nramp family divalent metal transporter [Bacteroidales bacterium]
MEKAWYQKIGPGIVIAATGVGAGDLVAASVAGSKYGTVILWSVLVGGLIKYVLNEGIARWQISTGETFIDALKTRFHSALGYYFLVYLFLWSFVVGAAMAGASGLAAHAFFPQLSVAWWGVIHAVVAFAFVLWGNYKWLEIIMKFFIALMFLVVMTTAILISPDWIAALKSLFTPAVPAASVPFLLGVIGGVGGSVTLLSYGYWIQEKGWTDQSHIKTIRLDLAVAYALTVLFGIAIIILSAEVKPEITQGNQIVLGLADKIGETSGEVGKWIFMLGFWGAVFSSMLGVWQGIPYLFMDYMKTTTSNTLIIKYLRQNENLSYRWFLVYLALFPLILLFTQKPVWIIIGYAIIGSFFMPFLGVIILFLNNLKSKLNNLRNGWLTNLLLVIALFVFAILLFLEIQRLFF